MFKAVSRSVHRRCKAGSTRRNREYSTCTFYFLFCMYSTYLDLRMVGMGYLLALPLKYSWLRRANFLLKAKASTPQAHDTLAY